MRIDEKIFGVEKLKGVDATSKAIVMSIAKEFDRVHPDVAIDLVPDSNVIAITAQTKDGQAIVSVGFDTTQVAPGK